MARQPYFSGNYGSALAQIDTRPIMQGAAAQAAMYQSVGQDIGGAIEKYQLNKEKREQGEAAATGTIQSIMQNNPQALQTLSQDPKFAKAMERMQTDEASPKDFNLINSATAAYRVQQNAALEQEGARAKNDAIKSGTIITDLQGQLNKRTMGDKEQQSHSEAWATELANEQTVLENDLLKAKSKADKDRLGRDLEDHKLKMKTTRLAFKANKADLDLFNKTYEDKARLAKAEADAAEAEIDLTKARKELTKEETLLKKAEALTEKNKKKYNPGDPVGDIGGRPFYWDGSKAVPVGAELTPSEATKEALKAFGGDALLTYYADTRDDKGKIKTKSWSTSGGLVDLDDFKENLLLKIGMKVNDKKPAPPPTSGTAADPLGLR